MSTNSDSSSTNELPFSTRMEERRDRAGAVDSGTASGSPSEIEPAIDDLAALTHGAPVPHGTYVDPFGFHRHLSSSTNASTSGPREVLRDTHLSSSAPYRSDNSAHPQHPQHSPLHHAHQSHQSTARWNEFTSPAMRMRSYHDTPFRGRVEPGNEPWNQTGAPADHVGFGGGAHASGSDGREHGFQRQSRSWPQSSSSSRGSGSGGSQPSQQQQQGGAGKGRASRSGKTRQRNVADHERRSRDFVESMVQKCHERGFQPTPQVLERVKITMKNQTPKVRLSVCHCNLDDRQLFVLLEVMREQGQDIEEVLLNHNQISDTGATQLAANLCELRNVNSVELFANNLTDACTEQIGRLLATCPTLKRLKLGDNRITGRGMSRIAEGLAQNQELVQLHVGGNPIGPGGVMQLCAALAENHSLTSLGLRECEIDVEGCRALGDLLQRNGCPVVDIQLKGNRIGPEGAFHIGRGLRDNGCLRVLELQGNGMEAETVRRLADGLKHNNNVHALNFNDNDLGDDGAEVIADLLKANANITTLGLASNRILRRGAAAIAQALNSSGLTGIDLGSNMLGNNGAISLAEVLKTNTCLTSLDLRSCEIRLRGILSLAEMLETNDTLRHLDLSSNQARNQGAKKIAEAMTRNRTLTRLCLTDNNIHVEGGEALANAIKSNSSLRKFSYGGQGQAANHIEQRHKRIIDTQVASNKKRWDSRNAANAAGTDRDDDVAAAPPPQSAASASAAARQQRSAAQPSRSNTSSANHGPSSSSMPSVHAQQQSRARASHAMHQQQRAAQPPQQQQPEMAMPSYGTGASGERIDSARHRPQPQGRQDIWASSEAAGHASDVWGSTSATAITFGPARSAEWAGVPHQPMHGSVQRYPQQPLRSSMPISSTWDLPGTSSSAGAGAGGPGPGAAAAGSTAGGGQWGGVVGPVGVMKTPSPQLDARTAQFHPRSSSTPASRSSPTIMDAHDTVHEANLLQLSMPNDIDTADTGRKRVSPRSQRQHVVSGEGTSMLYDDAPGRSRESVASREDEMRAHLRALELTDESVRSASYGSRSMPSQGFGSMNQYSGPQTAQPASYGSASPKRGIYAAAGSASAGSGTAAGGGSGGSWPSWFNDSYGCQRGWDYKELRSRVRAVFSAGFVDGPIELWRLQRLYLTCHGGKTTCPSVEQFAHFLVTQSDFDVQLHPYDPADCVVALRSASPWPVMDM